MDKVQKPNISERRLCLRLQKTTGKHAMQFACELWILKEKDWTRLDAQQIGLLSSVSSRRYHEMAREQLG
jgi:hypothetical protein